MTHIITNMCADVRGKVITWRRLFDTCLPISWQWKVAQAPKLAGRVHVPRVTLHTTYKVKRSRSPGHSGWLFKWLAGGGGIFWRPHNLFEHLLVSSWVYIRLNVKYFNIFFHILHHELKPVLVYLRTSLIRRFLAIIFSVKFLPFCQIWNFLRIFEWCFKFSCTDGMMSMIHFCCQLTWVNVDLRAIKQVFVSTAHQWLRHCTSSAFFTFTNIFHFASIIM